MDTLDANLTAHHNVKHELPDNLAIILFPGTYKKEINTHFWVKNLCVNALIRRTVHHSRRKKIMQLPIN